MCASAHAEANLQRSIPMPRLPGLFPKILSAITRRSVAAGSMQVDGRRWVFAQTAFVLVVGLLLTGIVAYREMQIDAGIDTGAPALTGAGGTLLSVLFALLVWSLGRARLQAQAIAQEMRGRLSHAKDRAESATAEAQAAREQVQAFLDCAPVAIFAVDPTGMVRYCNRGLGAHDRSEVTGSSWLRFVPPEQQAALESAFRDVLDTGMPRTCSLTVPSVSGGWLSYACYIGPRYHEGEVAGAVIAAQDLTEEQRVQARLVASQRLVTVGSLAAGLAHEINTPIQFVGDSLHFLRDASTDVFRLVEVLQALHRAVHDDPGALAGLAAAAAVAMEAADLDYLHENMPKAFERSLDGLDRVTTIVRSMKEFSHPGQEQMKAVDLNRAIQSTLVVGRNEYKYIADVETDFGDIPQVTCHINEINQVILNIVVNAAHAIADVVKGADMKGKITVRTRREGDDVVISITDTGSGIPESARGRVFDPFFTTKEVGRGTGQGLAIAWSLVKENHDGELSFITALGEGTTFFIRLPIAGRTVATPKEVLTTALAPAPVRYEI